jgi:hypothetical protein
MGKTMCGEQVRLVPLVLVLALLGAPACSAEGERAEAPRAEAAVETLEGRPPASGKHLVYVPAYQYAVDENGRTPLAVTLTVHNTSLDPIRIHGVEFYDADGVLVERLLSAPRELGALGTIEFVRPKGDLDGGAGANFLIAWGGDDLSQAPLAEALMVGHQGAGRLTFTSRGVPIERSKSTPSR